MLANWQHDTAKHCTEFIYSTDSALLGVRGLYNFGPDPINALQSSELSPDVTLEKASEASGLVTAEMDTQQRPQGRLSAGGEIYYGLLNKSGGASLGLRFATLPNYAGFPYTMTVTLNPLMGNLSSTYSVLASSLLTLSTRFNFNVYSYDSEVQIGTELWRRKAPNVHGDADLNWARAKLGLDPLPEANPMVGITDEFSGCLKARLDQRGALTVQWEGRVKELLYTCGLTVDLRGRENMFRGFGVEFQYSS